MFNFKKRNSPYSGVKKSFIIKLFGFFLILSIIVGLIFNSKFKVITVKNLNLKPQSLSCANTHQISSTSGLMGQNFFSIDKNIVEEKLTKKYFCLKNIELYKKFPDSVDLTLVSRVPVAVVKKIPSSNLSEPVIDVSNEEATLSAKMVSPNFEVNEASVSGTFLADNSSFVFSSESMDGLPVFYIVNDRLDLGFQLANDQIAKGLELLTKINELSLNPQVIKMDDQKILVNADSDLTFSLDEDLNKQIASLQLILQKAKINSKSVDRADFRFDKVVVVYSSKK